MLSSLPFPCLSDVPQPPPPATSVGDPPSYGLACDIVNGEGPWVSGYESDHKVGCCVLLSVS